MRFGILLLLACVWVFQYSRVEKWSVWQRGEKWVLGEMLGMYEREKLELYDRGVVGWEALRWGEDEKAGAEAERQLGVVGVGDDVEKIFQESPPSVIDYAVMLRNLRRLGVKNLAMVVPMCWGEVDPIGRAALEREMGSFVGLQTGVSLLRSGEMAEMPTAFFRASWKIPVGRGGEFSRIPWVDCVRDGRAVLGEGNVVAGFSRLASEDAREDRWLVARWGDRLVFSVGMLSYLAEQHVGVQEVEVVPGQRIFWRNGEGGVPIDEEGRLRMKSLKCEGKTREVMAAQRLIDAKFLLSRSFWFLGGVEGGEFMKGASGWLEQRGELARVKVFGRYEILRVSALREWNWLWGCVVLTLVLFWLPRVASLLLFFVSIGCVCVGQMVLVKGGGWWLPGGGMVVIFLLGLVLSSWRAKSRVREDVCDLRELERFE